MGKGGSSSPATTPAEAQASASAAPYLAEYNSGKLSAADQSTVNLADTNQTGAALQSFAENGMGASTSLGQSVGVVTKGTSQHGMQAGAGSAVDLAKLSMTNQILNYDLQMGQAYMQISSGQAADLASIQTAAAQAQAAAFSKVSQSFMGILGGMQGGEGSQHGFDDSLDPNTPYTGPGSMTPEVAAYYNYG